MTDHPTRAGLVPPAAARSAASPAAADHRAADPLVAAPRALGNQAMQRRLLEPMIQRAAIDPPITAPQDEHEREAERVAGLLTAGATLPDGAIGGAPTGIGRAPEDEKKKPKASGGAPAKAPPPKKAEPPQPKPPPKPAAAAPAAPSAEPSAPEPGRAPAGKSAEAIPPAPDAPAGEAPKMADEAGPPAAVPEKKKEDERAIARAPEGATSSAPRVTPAVRSGIGGAAGSGRPLEPAAQSRFERGLGHDLSSVRVHDDAPAARAASDLQAQAFTYGQDVFFGADRYQPDTPEGSKLLAHELTHTVQQRPGSLLHRRAIQRNGTTAPPPGQPAAPVPGAPAAAPPAAAPVDPAALGYDKGKLETTPEPAAVVFDQLPIPAFKATGHRGTAFDAHLPLHHQKSYDRGNPAQRDKWRENVRLGAAAVALLQAKHPDVPPTGQPYVFAGPAAPIPGQPATGGTLNRYFVGTTLQDVANTMNLPSWDASGARHSYDVDHIVELQLAGWNKAAGHWANELPNMELLDSSANRSSGSQIATSLNTRIQTFIDETRGVPGFPRSPEALKNRYHLKFQQKALGAAAPTVERNDYWSRSEIEAGEHLNIAAIRPALPDELGDASHIKVFSRQNGGVPKTFSWTPGGTTAVGSYERDWLAPFRITRKQFNVGPTELAQPDFGSFNVSLPSGDEKWEPVPPTPIPLRRMPGLQFAGHLDRIQMRSILSGFRKKGASPIQIDEEPDVMDGGGIGVHGRIMPEIPALQGVGIDFDIAGDDIRIFKAFSIEDVKVPRPLSVDNVSLVASAGTTSGLALTGQVDFGIEHVGTGMLRASAGTQRGIEFDGSFDFDSRLFDPARITIGYHEGQWSGAGDLGIPPGKVPGIRRGLFHASYAEGRLDATGTAETTIPGVSQASVALSYSETEGLAIGGQLTLAPTVPGLRGGSLEARVQERPETGDYRVTAHGEAQPAIPGVDTTLTIDYDDGALTIQGTAAYARGPMSGQLTLGATNRPVNPDGTIVPTGAPTETLTAYGGGQATIRLTPWLQGTAGLRILPNGQIELSGAIGLPSTIDIFPEKSYTRNILTIGLDIPIVGVAVAGARVGIFATIAGGLDFSAGVGPGQLQELGLQVTFNPDQPDQTHIEGGARLHIPAHAGLRLFVRGGLGAGIPLVSATAGLEVGGALGLEAAVDASVHVDWMPDRGLILDAAGEVSVEPRFRFDITGFVLVEAGAFGFTIELYSQRWQLAALEYGSGLRLGMRFPIHYEEGQPFDISWSDVQFEIPDVNPREVLSGLIAQIA